jgi:hypothetical protein
LSKSTNPALPNNVLPHPAALPHAGLPHAPGSAHADAYAELLKHTDLQFNLPSYKQPAPPPWLKWLGDFLSQAGPELRWLFWALVAGLAALVLYVLARQAMKLRWRPRDKAEGKVAEAAWRPAPEKARLLLADADRLAASGDFAAAVHLLLLRSIQDIEERFPRLLRPAFTSREIGRLEQIPSNARATFAGIARIVEQSLFGGGTVGKEDFARCRESYEHFAFPDSWSAVA